MVPIIASGSPVEEEDITSTRLDYIDVSSSSLLTPLNDEAGSSIINLTYEKEEAGGAVGRSAQQTPTPPTEAAATTAIASIAAAVAEQQANNDGLVEQQEAVLLLTPRLELLDSLKASNYFLYW